MLQSYFFIVLSVCVFSVNLYPAAAAAAGASEGFPAVWTRYAQLKELDVKEFIGKHGIPPLKEFQEALIASDGSLGGVLSVLKKYMAIVSDESVNRALLYVAYNPDVVVDFALRNEHRSLEQRGSDLFASLKSVRGAAVGGRLDRVADGGAFFGALVGIDECATTALALMGRQRYLDNRVAGLVAESSKISENLISSGVDLALGRRREIDKEVANIRKEQDSLGRRIALLIWPKEYFGISFNSFLSGSDVPPYQQSVRAYLWNPDKRTDRAKKNLLDPFYPGELGSVTGDDIERVNESAKKWVAHCFPYGHDGTVRLYDVALRLFEASKSDMQKWFRQRFEGGEAPTEILDKISGQLKCREIRPFQYEKMRSYFVESRELLNARFNVIYSNFLRAYLLYDADAREKVPAAWWHRYVAFYDDIVKDGLPARPGYLSALVETQVRRDAITDFYNKEFFGDAGNALTFYEKVFAEVTAGNTDITPLHRLFHQWETDGRVSAAGNPLMRKVFIDKEIARKKDEIEASQREKYEEVMSWAQKKFEDLFFRDGLEINALAEATVAAHRESPIPGSDILSSDIENVAVLEAFAESESHLKELEKKEKDKWVEMLYGEEVVPRGDARIIYPELIERLTRELSREDVAHFGGFLPLLTSESVRARFDRFRAKFEEAVARDEDGKLTVLGGAEQGILTQESGVKFVAPLLTEIVKKRQIEADRAATLSHLTASASGAAAAVGNSVSRLASSVADVSRSVADLVSLGRSARVKDTTTPSGRSAEGGAAHVQGNRGHVRPVGTGESPDWTERYRGGVATRNQSAYEGAGELANFDPLKHAQDLREQKAAAVIQGLARARRTRNRFAFLAGERPEAPHATASRQPATADDSQLPTQITDEFREYLERLKREREAARRDEALPDRPELVNPADPAPIPSGDGDDEAEEGPVAETLIPSKKPEKNAWTTGQIVATGGISLGAGATIIAGVTLYYDGKPLEEVPQGLRQLVWIGRKIGGYEE